MADKNLPAKVSPFSKRFTDMVMGEFASFTNQPLALDAHQKKLSQHLFVKVDSALKALEVKRSRSSNDNRAPIIWENVNLNKLALDAVYRIDLGLDALIPNHMHVIPYFNNKEGKYDIDLRVGYVGEDYYRRQAAVETPLDVIYELVHVNDTFKVIKKGYKQSVESYEFAIPNPWDRGAVLGGFGYIMYEDERKNKLVIVTAADFQKSKASAKSNDFWGKHETEMQYKTLVHRVTSKIAIDPRKMSEAIAHVEADDEGPIIDQELITEQANTGDFIDVEPEYPDHDKNKKEEKGQVNCEQGQQEVPRQPNF